MARKRGKVSKSELELGRHADLFSPTEPKQPKDKRRNRIVKRATYDMTPELKTAVMKRAYKLGIPASQFAMFLLCDALRRFDAGEIDPAPWIVESDSPKFANSLEFGDWYHLGDDE